MAHVISTEVDINAYYFAGKELKSFPRQMEYRGQAITFTEGLRLRLQRSGRTAAYLFNMSSTDGSTYRLLQEGNRWTLVGA